MNKNKMALTALGLGAAYLMRNKDARGKLAKQFDNFAGTPMRGQKSDTHSETRSPQSTGRKKGLLQNILG
ncbi:hypothetical protein MHZ95_05905 [Sporosarcina sp. ACRSM]|uniref:hypothetical protein n=1 Tax=Sporosarcina sp. ACRSM TaxID=2918216 RepID=UPI001EF53B38|nr:hypothetical protein [Sporosarcina sp. ACRSM]MCG7334803.1 hypothetical protein [Sporosarcina sp. ACRSM]